MSEHSTKTAKEIAEEIMGYDATDHDGQLPSEPEQIEALLVKAIEADRAQRELTLVVLAKEQTWTDDTQAEVLDVDYILSGGAEDYSEAELDAIEAKLREHGWESIADDVADARVGA